MEAKMAAPWLRRRTAVGLLVAFAAASGMTACGSNDDSGDAAGTGPAATSSPPTQTKAADAGTTASGPGVTDYVQYTGGTKGAADASKSKIVIGWTNQQGGPADPSPYATDGAKLAVKYVNEELGGVDGHPIELASCFTSTTEEQGQSCGQKFANDDGVDVVAVGAMSIGSQPLMASIDGAKPMVYSVAAGASDAQNKNGYILFGDLIRVLPPLATFSKEVLKAKTAAVIYPEAPGVSYAADALTGGLKAAGITYKRVSYPANATDLVAPLSAAGAQTADVVNPVVLPPQCVTVAKALQRSKVTAPVVATPLCLNSNVAKALGDLPQWYYGIASSLTADRSDPAAGAFMAVAAKNGGAQKAADPYYSISFAEILTIVQWMNAVGPDKLSPEAIAAKAKAFKGPLALGPPTVQCGEYTDAPAICNDQMKVFKYEGKGQFKPASGWIGPPS
jgi:branched-chain amino acid transport system substrate-binding protein